MKKIRLEDINLLDIGDTVQMTGAVYTGNGQNFIVPLPGEYSEMETSEYVVMEMDDEEWQRFLRQADVVDVEGPGKAILRKSQRQIDNKVSWTVFRRDNFKCRYTGDTMSPLTVDHIITWEEGGPSVPENLISCSRRANKMRGNMPYEDWITSDKYKQISKDLTTAEKLRNIEIVNKLPYLRTLTTDRRRSR